MGKLLIYTLLLVCIVVAVAAHASMESSDAPVGATCKTVVATGVGSSTDQAKARDEALADAQQRAVEQVVGLYINSSTLVENMQLIRDTVYRNAQGYLKEYTIVSEGRDADGMYRMTIRATVQMATLSDQLNLLAARLAIAGSPKILVYFSPTHDRNTDALVRSTITSKLLAVGFTIVDKPSGSVNDLLTKYLDGTTAPEALASLHATADIVIVGKYTCSAQRTPANFDAVTAQATIDASAIKTDTGDIITNTCGTSGGYRAGFTQSDAIRRAVTAAGESWVQQNMANLIKTAIDPGHRCLITLVDCQLPDASQFCDQLEAMRYVRRVHLHDFHQNRALVDLEYLGKLTEVAEYLRTVTGLNMQITDMTENTMRIQVSRNTP
ncbi:MAG TPA: hypothetical protein VHV83_17755 [Armatimonadota bacterium]|nr:hypothetical protein [Armatimonadota bacterium]